MVIRRLDKLTGWPCEWQPFDWQGRYAASRQRVTLHTTVTTLNSCTIRIGLDLHATLRN